VTISERLAAARRERRVLARVSRAAWRPRLAVIPWDGKKRPCSST
jgi:hypothetical protein